MLSRLLTSGPTGSTECYESPKLFLLWGKMADKFAKEIDLHAGRISIRSDVDLAAPRQSAIIGTHRHRLDHLPVKFVWKDLVELKMKERLLLQARPLDRL